jgi:hypothetical protein
MDHERCVACGFDGSEFDDPGLLDGLRSLGPTWRTLLGSAGDELRDRPAPATWSAIEYAAHSRDVTALHVWGVEQALAGGEPVIPDVAGDDLIESAAATYSEADPADVVDALEDQADRLADVAHHAGSGTWARGITIGRSRSDVRRLLEHALHDSRHHLDDVERGLAVLRGTGR